MLCCINPTVYKVVCSQVNQKNIYIQTCCDVYTHILIRNNEQSCLAHALEKYFRPQFVCFFFKEKYIGCNGCQMSVLFLHQYFFILVETLPHIKDPRFIMFLVIFSEDQQIYLVSPFHKLLIKTVSPQLFNFIQMYSFNKTKHFQ